MNAKGHGCVQVGTRHHAYRLARPDQCALILWRTRGLTVHSLAYIPITLHDYGSGLQVFLVVRLVVALLLVKLVKTLESMGSFDLAALLHSGETGSVHVVNSLVSLLVAYTLK